MKIRRWAVRTAVKVSMRNMKQVLRGQIVHLLLHRRFANHAMKGLLDECLRYPHQLLNILRKTQD